MKKIEQKIKDGIRLTEREQLKLVKSGNVELIRQYISRNINKSFFAQKAEAEFIKLGYVSLIELYINRYTLYADARQELVKRECAFIVLLNFIINPNIIVYGND